MVGLFLITKGNVVFIINYFLNTLYHRGYLLKLMINKCKEINKDKSRDNSRFDTTFQTIIQIDIISKIMLYTEDFIVFLIANKDNDGFYYNLLDEKNLGNRIYDFISKIDGFRSGDYSKMMGYKLPNNLSENDKNFNGKIIKYRN